MTATVEQGAERDARSWNRDRRLVLLSDPVTMARLHFRVWNSPEIFFMGELLRRDKAQSTGIA